MKRIEMNKFLRREVLECGGKLYLFCMDPTDREHMALDTDLAKKAKSSGHDYIRIRDPKYNLHKKINVVKINMLEYIIYNESGEEVYREQLEV